MASKARLDIPHRMRFSISTLEKITVLKVREEGDCIFLLSFHGIISCHLTEENVKTVHFSPIYLETFRSNIRYHQPPAPPPSLDLKYGFAFIC